MLVNAPINLFLHATLINVVKYTVECISHIISVYDYF